VRTHAQGHAAKRRWNLKTLWPYATAACVILLSMTTFGDDYDRTLCGVSIPVFLSAVVVAKLVGLLRLWGLRGG
jgi:hypothetical protein